MNALNYTKYSISILFIGIFIYSCGLPDAVPVISSPTVTIGANISVAGQNTTSDIHDYGISIYYKLYAQQSDINLHREALTTWKSKITQPFASIAQELGYTRAELIPLPNPVPFLPRSNNPSLSLDLVLAWNATIKTSSLEFGPPLQFTITIDGVSYALAYTLTEDVVQFFDQAPEDKPYIGFFIFAFGNSIIEGLLASDPVSLNLDTLLTLEP